jgi:hypothetical protein
MYYLNKEELELLKVNWRPKDFEPWSIEVSGRGVIAFTKSKDKTATAVLFCRADKIPRLFLRADSVSTSFGRIAADFAWYAQAINSTESMSAFGITVPKSSVALKKIDGAAPALEFALPTFRLEHLTNMREIRVESGLPRSSWFYFDLPKTNAVPTMAVALKNCV